MDLLCELPLTFYRIPMFPFFDLAHYLTSVMALREQPGAMEVAWRSPLASWFSAMLFCFGGGILSALMLAEPPILFLSKEVDLSMASAAWFVVFYCPGDLVYQFFSILPIRIIISGMKEMTRTRKILAGVIHADSQYPDAWMLMVAVGWARGAGSGLISNFEQLVRGIWKPECNELLEMSYPVKVSLLGAILFTLQQTEYLSVSKYHLIFLYSIFLVVTKVLMMTGSRISPFAPFEAVMKYFVCHWMTIPPELKKDFSTAPNSTSRAPKHLPEKEEDCGDSSDHTNEEICDTIRKRHTKKSE